VRIKRVLDTMPRILAVGNQKGGAGKTTVAVNLACAWADEGRRVLVVDADPQQSAAQWLADQTAVAVVLHQGGGLERLLPTLHAHYDVIVLDLPPGHPAVIRSALLVADTFVVPIPPSAIDIRAAAVTFQLAKDARPRVRLVLNRLQPWTILGRTVRAAVKAYGLPIYRAELGQRVAYPEAAATCQSVLGYEPSGPAAAEVRALAKEVWTDGR
jgi:chromosome partitioning protein